MQLPDKLIVYVSLQLTSSWTHFHTCANPHSCIYTNTALQEKQRQLEEASVVVPATKEPGWYKQMSQSFQTTVQEAFPGGRAIVQLYT